MKILVINGSPKGEKSNSFQVAKAFLKGINEGNAGNEVEICHLSDKKIGHCLGCFGCWKKTPGICVLKDDMAQILKRVIEADLILYSFPLYYFSLPGLLKNYFDRLLPLALPFMEENTSGIGHGAHAARYDLSKQKIVAISTCGFYTAEGNYEAVKDMLNYVYGKGNYFSLFVGQGELFSIPELQERTSAYLTSVQLAGKEYITEGKISKNTLQILDEHLYPKDVYETMADASWGVKKEGGEKVSEALSFTRQMAALYNKESFDGKETLLEINYTDRGEKYYLKLGKSGCEVLLEAPFPPTTTILTPFDVWKDIASRKIRGDEALMKGLYRVEGDFDLLLHWDDYFGYKTKKANGNHTIKERKAKTTMLNFLLPFIAFFVALPIHSFYGAIAVLLFDFSWAILSYRTRKTFFDSLSLCLSGLLSCFALLFGDSSILYLVPSSYLLFGLVWLITSFTKLPVSAYYSSNDYGEEDAFQNPIFIKTNKILCFWWGVLYLLTAVFTFLMMYFFEDFSPYLGLINSVVPFFMGLFTKWFISFYPRWIAKGKKK